MDRHFDDYSYDGYAHEHFSRTFSPWRPSLWHLWVAGPIAVAVAVVLIFYAVL